MDVRVPTSKDPNYLESKTSTVAKLHTTYLCPKATVGKDTLGEMLAKSPKINMWTQSILNHLREGVGGYFHTKKKHFTKNAITFLIFKHFPQEKNCEN